MKKVCKGFSILIILLILIPSYAIAKEGVPQKALDARESVFRVLCEDNEYIYSGSSFVVATDDKGTYLATNYHVIENAKNSIVVVLHDGSKLPAEIVEYVADYDLCILRTANMGSDPLPLASNTNISAGDAVYALGFPGAADYLVDDYAYAAADITITDGIISAVKRAITNGIETTFLQMNAAINAGSSGGPLVNEAGQVVGINTLGILDANDIYAAVHIEHLISLLNKSNITFTPSVPVENTAPKPAIGLLWIVAGAVVILIIATVLFTILIKRRLTLEVLMERRLQGYSIAQAISKLRPIFNALRPLHERGEAHGGIYPDNIYIDQRGNFRLGRRSKKRNLNEKAKPYLPMEAYSSSSGGGPYSDVYALGSVILYMITRKQPVDIFARLQKDTIIEQINEMSSLPEEWKGLTLAALALNKEERPHDIGALLGLIEAAPPYCAENTISEQPQDIRIKRPLSRRTVLIAGCAVLLLAGAAIWTISRFHYDQAISYLDEKNYAAARDEIAGTFLIHKDITKLAYYIDSAYFMSEGYYDEAKSRFETLGGYKDSPLMVQQCDYLKAQKLLGDGKFSLAKALFITLGKYLNSGEMVLDCDYREAKHLLDLNEFDKAKELFSKLASENYKDSRKMTLETDYQHALAIYESFLSSDSSQKSRIDIGKALTLLKPMADYSDANKDILDIEGSIYKEAVSRFISAVEFLEAPPDSLERYLSALVDCHDNIKIAKSYFTTIRDFSDADKYLSVCDIIEDQSDTTKNYAALIKLWNFYPAERIILGDTYIYHFLRGSWRGDGHSFKLTIKSDESMTSTYDIPWFNGGDYFQIKGLIYYIGSDEEGWTEMYRFDVLNHYVVNVYAYRNGRTYTLVRQ